MKIKVGTRNDPEWTTIEIDSTWHNVLIQENFTGVLFETDQGVFGIANRDDGIEIRLGGNLVWSSMELRGES